MISFFTKSAVWQLIIQSDFVSKLILLGLFILSVVCCAIIAYKWLRLREQRKQMNFLISRIKQVKSLNDLVAISKEHRGSIGGRFLVEMFTELKKMDGHLAARDIEYVEVVMNQVVEQLVMEEEQYMPVLGTSAAVSPLIGLFGTVWGLIHSFISISQEKTADIAVVAPGIAEALITTLAGLVVAIPAMIFFHYFANEIRSVEQQLLSVSDTFLGMVKRNFNA